MLFLYLVGVIILAEKFAIPLDNLVERFGMPQALGGAIVATLVLAPEALAGIRAAMHNQLQRSVNILHEREWGVAEIQPAKIRSPRDHRRWREGTQTGCEANAQSKRENVAHGKSKN